MEHIHNSSRSAAIPREAELLIACGAACATNQGTERIAGLAGDEIDWESLLRIAAGHGMTSIVWRSLSLHAKRVPAEVLALLRTRYLTNSARNLYLANELLNVLDLLESNGVPAIAFKGPALAAAAYGEPGLREFSDLDILVQPSTFIRARQTLIEHGYRPRCSDQRALESAVFQCFEDAFVADDGVAVLDVHWRIVPRYLSFPDSESLWARARRAELQGRYVNTLAAEDLLLFLCVHGAKHGWPLLSWICDLAGLIHRNDSLDWPVLFSRAESVRNRRPLLLGLRLAHDLMGAVIPSEFLAAVRADPAVARLGVRATRSMFRNLGERAGLFQELILPLRSIESPRQRIRYLADRALTPTLEDWEALPLPPPLFALYYLTRPFRLAFAKGKKLLRG